MNFDIANKKYVNACSNKAENKIFELYTGNNQNKNTNLDFIFKIQIIVVREYFNQKFFYYSQLLLEQIRYIIGIGSILKTCIYYYTIRYQ